MLKLDSYHYFAQIDCKRDHRLFGYFPVWRRVYFRGKWTPIMYLWFCK